VRSAWWQLDMAFQYDTDTEGPEGFAYDAGDYAGGGGEPIPDPEPVSQGSRRLTLPEWLRGVT